MSTDVCSCGCTEDHVIARAQTFDGVAVQLWSSGDITGRLGTYPAGLGKARSRVTALGAARLAWDEISLYDWAEVATLVKTARKALEQRLLPPVAFLRRSMGGESFRSVGRPSRPVVQGYRREHHHSCQCRQCGGRDLPRGWIAAPVKYAKGR